MTDLRKAAEMALEALQHANDVGRCVEDCYTADINALRQALYVDKVYMSEKHVHKSDKSIHEPLYMDMSQVPTGMPDWKPGMVFPAPKKEWVGLTDADIAQTMHGSVEGSNMLPYQFARAIEAKLKEKNT